VNENEILASAPERIRASRSTEVELRLVDDRGAPLPHREVRVQLVRHEFKFGCNAFLLDRIADRESQRAYEERFTGLLNYATLPFYWGGYERAKGVTDEVRLHQMAEWCTRHGIPAKGHPLVWHEVYPTWGHTCADGEVLARLERRVVDVVSRFRGRVDTWDVVNEATVSHRFDNAVGRWIAREGAVACVAQALRWARGANPSATLLYNDFNLSEDFQRLIADLLDRGAPLDAIGIQSHMHKGTWSLERAWQACEIYARFGLPLHWTELTVLSGRPKAPDDDDWHARHTDWVSTPGGETAQAEYGERLYTLLFSHPAVEAITWWDFSDRGSWQGAPSGLIREDMSPKPLYERLRYLVGGEWSTDDQATSDEDGRARLRCTYGHYRVEAGPGLEGSFDLSRKGERSIKVTLRPA
jgi:GH35 family endo-1,4-beta-xylanase